MSFKLGKRSLERLEGVDERMVEIVKLAITLSKNDFTVLEGLRTKERQAELVKAGNSQTMKSKHLEGKAVDLGAYDPVTGIRGKKTHISRLLMQWLKRLESLTSNCAGGLHGLFQNTLIHTIVLIGMAI